MVLREQRSGSEGMTVLLYCSALPGRNRDGCCWQMFKSCQKLQAGVPLSPSTMLTQGATSQHPPGHPAQTLACPSRALLRCLGCHPSG
ncbi:unnamed protein product [Bubo scandiacus]